MANTAENASSCQKKNAKKNGMRTQLREIIKNNLQSKSKEELIDMLVDICMLYPPFSMMEATQSVRQISI